MRMLSTGLPGLVVVLSLGLLLPAAASAIEGQLLLPSGEPAVGYQVSVVGLPVSATTNAEGRFRIVPDPRPPFRLIATGPGGEVSPPLDVDQFPEGGLVLVIPTAFKDSITVASGVAPNIETPPAAATLVLGQEELEQRRPPRLHDALQGVAGASRTDETSTGVPVLRGLGRGRTLILLDGARVTTERRAGASASFLDPFTLSSIEIARGPGSVAYGSDAFGGVINALPRYPEPGNPSLNFQVDQGFGADDETSAGVDISRDLAGGALLGQLTWRESGLQEAGGGEEIPGSEYEDRSGALRYTRDTPIGRLRAGFYAADAIDVGKPASDWDTVQTTYPKESTRRFNLQLDSGPLSGGWENLELGLFLGSYRLVTDRDRVASTPRLIESSDVDANDGSIRALATREVFGGRLLVGTEVVSRFGLEAITARDTFSVEGERISERSSAIEDAQQIDTAVFTSFDRSLGAKTLLSVGVRGDRVETENQDGFFGDRSTEHTGLSGHAALTVGPFRDVTASFQVARGFRDPFLSDRYFRGPSGRGFITGNPDLDPERSLQYDTSVRWSVGGGSVALFGYIY
jgi:outer membrane receptor protein involved in Fe transport